MNCQGARSGQETSGAASVIIHNTPQHNGAANRAAPNSLSHHQCDVWPPLETSALWGKDETTDRQGAVTDNAELCRGSIGKIDAVKSGDGWRGKRHEHFSAGRDSKPDSIQDSKAFRVMHHR